MIKGFIRHITEPGNARAVRQFRLEPSRVRLSLLCRVLLLAVLVSPSQAQFEYTAQNGTVTILRFTGAGGAVVIPDAIDGLPVTRIGAGAFYGRTNVISIAIPAGVVGLGNSSLDYAVDAFAGCNSPGVIDVDPANGSYSSIDGILFNKSQTTLLACPTAKTGTYTLPGTVTQIADGALSGCGELTSITISNRVTRIGERAFAGCRGLTSITLPRISRIGDRAFSDCTSLTNVTISNGVTQIGRGAFSGCRSLVSMTIPASVVSIGDWAFSGCDRFESVALPSGLSSIGNRAFLGCDSLSAIMVDRRNNNFSSADGVLFNKQQTSLVACPGGRVGSFAIPNTVTDIQEGAFSGCEQLSSIEIPGGVTRIADGAFSGCGSLTQVTFPGSLTRIGYGAFSDCGSLSTLTFPATLTQVGNGAFYGCHSLTDAYFEGNAPSADSGLASRLSFEAGRATFYCLPETTGWNSFGGRRLDWKPQLLASDFGAAPQTHGFKFTIAWARDRKVAVEASDSLTDPTWSPIGTVTLSTGALEFGDPGWTNSPARFYRLRAVIEN